MQDRVELSGKPKEIVDIFDDFRERLGNRGRSGLSVAANLTLAAVISQKSSDEIFKLFSQIKNSSEVLEINDDVSATLTLASVINPNTL